MKTYEKVLGTVVQLLTDNAIVREVRVHHRNLAVAYYDYQKAYDMVHHDWMLGAYEWLGIERKVQNVMEEVIKKWKTLLEVRNGSKLLWTRWVNIKKEFLQEDTYTPVGFCCLEITVMMLLKESDGYKMGLPGKRGINTHRHTHTHTHTHTHIKFYL